MKSRYSPWAWLPSLYFIEGLPYFIVNVISVTMFKRMGMGNGDIALYTSLLYLPWVIKPLWSPFVDVIRSKRWWIILMQLIMTGALLLLFTTLPRPEITEIAQGNIGIRPFIFTLILFYITAFASATHDIAADGFYMLALDEHNQSMFVGIRSTFYRIASVFGQGVLVAIAGTLESWMGDIPKAWAITLMICSLIMALTSIYHIIILPKVERPSVKKSISQVGKDLLDAFISFFRKKGLGMALVFMLLFRLPEAFAVKMLTPFMLDNTELGGLGLSTTESGLVYGIVGVIALTLGGILGGLAASKWGLKKSLWPMSLSLALPCAVYLYMAIAQPVSLIPVYICVALDQFGYGFGFTAYMLYMMWFSQGDYKTSHYALCTAFMALSMMIPGLFAGWMQEALGYVGFFTVVMICCIATVVVTLIARKQIDTEYGKK